MGLSDYHCIGGSKKEGVKKKICAVFKKTNASALHMMGGPGS
jgi:hypothetical protein